MPGIPMKPTVAVEIQRQFNQEYRAAHAYTALAAWCEDRDYKGFARYFKKQAHEERGHAEKMMAHLLDRSLLPELTAVTAPKIKFESLMEVARHAQAMEQSNTQGINAAYEAALAAKDYGAQMLFQWFITEQTEEESWADELVDRVERSNCAGGFAELDRHIERYLSESVIGEPESK